MVDIKINASFILQGGVLPAEPSDAQKSEKKKGKKKKEEKENPESTISYRQEVVKAGRDRIVINLREGKPIKQVLHICQEAYDYMVSPDNPSDGINLYEWKKLSLNKRVKYHLLDIAKSLNATLESFKIMED